MYRCHYCQKVVPPGTRAHHIVVETREVQYPSRGRAYDGPGKKQSKLLDPGGRGIEIVREVIACPSCARSFEHAVENREPAA